MPFPDRVNRWIPAVTAEIDRLPVPFPVDYVLAIIQRESNGTAGAVNPSSGASGLMQVMPIALKDYNQNNPDNYTMAQLRDKSPHAALIQIRVGLWVLQNFFRSAYKYLKKRLLDVPLDDLVKITDTFYAAGPGNARRRLDRIVPTWDNVIARYPKWDRIGPAELVWSRSGEGNWLLSEVEQWLEGKLDKERKQAIGGALIAIAIIALAWIAMRKDR